MANVTTQLQGSDSQRVLYSYSHGLQNVPGSPELERTSHLGSYILQRTLDPQWRLVTTLDGRFDQNRVATDTTREASQSVSAVGQFTRPFSDGMLFLSFGPRLGVLELDGQDTKFGWGTTAVLNTSLRRGTADYTAGYSLSFANDVGQEGTSVVQTAHVSAQTPVKEALLRGQLNFSAQRRYGTPLVAGALRTVDLTGSWQWRRFTVTGSASVASGLSNTVKDPGSGDGLFLALPYDQHTVTAILGGTATLTRYLDAAASARYTVVDYADRPNLSESELRAALHYGIGALRLTVDERYVISSSSTLGQDRRTSVFFVSVSRAFGNRY
jgi:hypothetical protein